MQCDLSMLSKLWQVARGRGWGREAEAEVEVEVKAEAAGRKIACLRVLGMAQWRHLPRFERDVLEKFHLHSSCSASNSLLRAALVGRREVGWYEKESKLQRLKERAWHFRKLGTCLQSFAPSVL